MSRGEKRDLQNSIKLLPGENLKRVAGIVKDHYVALGKEFPDEVIVNMEEEVSHLGNLTLTLDNYNKKFQKQMYVFRTT